MADLIFHIGSQYFDVSQLTSGRLSQPEISAGAPGDIRPVVVAQLTQGGTEGRLWKMSDDGGDRMTERGDVLRITAGKPRGNRRLAWTVGLCRGELYQDRELLQTQALNVLQDGYFRWQTSGTPLPLSATWQIVQTIQSDQWQMVRANPFRWLSAAGSTNRWGIARPFSLPTPFGWEYPLTDDDNSTFEMTFRNGALGTLPVGQDKALYLGLEFILVGWDIDLVRTPEWWLYWMSFNNNNASRSAPAVGAHAADL